MRILKGIGVGLVSIAALLGIVAVAARLSDGPIRWSSCASTADQRSSEHWR